jgi:1-deoxy-D-xylulose-5-phosphate reductoisomerase
LDLHFPPLNFFEAGPLTFQPVDRERFPALDLAYRALQEGGAMPVVLNAANEVAVEAFLQGQLGFLQISRLICKTMDHHRSSEQRSLESILQAHTWAKEEAQQLIHRGEL